MPEIKISWSAYCDLQDYLRDKEGAETGGMLFGVEPGPERYKYEVTHVFGPGPQAKHSRFNFDNDKSYDQGVIDAMRRIDPSLRCLGDWHSHPLPNLAPSEPDKAACRMLAEQMHAPLMVITHLSDDGSIATAGYSFLEGKFGTAYITVDEPGRPPELDLDSLWGAS